MAINVKLLKQDEGMFGNSIVVVHFDRPFSQSYINEIKKLTYRQYKPDSYEWWIHLNELDKYIKAVGIYNIAFKDEHLRDYYEKIGQQKQEQHLEDVSTRLAKVKQEVKYEWKAKPYPHQIEGFNEGVLNKTFLIADEQGLGKTITAIAIAEARYNVGLIDKCLIVCGVNSTKYNWQKEIKQFSNQKVYVLDGSNEQKKLDQIEAWKHSDALFGIINIEALRPNCELKGSKGQKKTEDRKALDQFIFHPSSGCWVSKSPLMTALSPILKGNMVVVDEIHKCKNILNSRQGIALQQLDATYKLGLSGTPITNKVMDIWNIMVWLGYEHRSYYQFRNDYCVMGGYNDKEIVGYKNLDQLHQLLSHKMLRRKKDEVLDLPDKIYLEEYVNLTKEQRKQYNDTRKGVLQVLNSASGLNGTFKTDTVLVQLMRMRQITDGLFSSLTQNSKLNRVREMLEEIVESGNKAIIFTNFETTASLYREQLEEYSPAYIVGETSVKDRQKEVERFQNDDSCKIIIGTIGAMGTGLTLTAASYVFFIDKYWNPSENMQAEDRAHRIGTKSNVTIISMIAKNTIDENIEEIVKSKSVTANAVVDGVETSLNGGTTDKMTKKFILELIKENEE